MFTGRHCVDIKEDSVDVKEVSSMKKAFMLVARHLNPWRWAMGLRYSMTGASVSLLLIGIVSLNIVWGYPWTGMFAACVSLFVVGRLINYLATPSLQASADAPRHVPSGTSLQIPVHLINEGRLPGMDLWIERDQRCDWLPPGDETMALQDVCYQHRGLQPLPATRVECYFPFYLFRTRTHVDSNTTIAVTPKPLSSDDDEHWRTLQNTLRGIATRISQGEQTHYIGSCEYREGIQVRRWDFASWARLGKPIVREFSSPATRSVSIWVDNVCNVTERAKTHWTRRFVSRAETPDAIHEPFERILSIAASSIETLTRNGAAVTLWLDQGGHMESFRCEAGGDPSELLIALASLRWITAEEAVGQELTDWGRELQLTGGDSLLVMSCQSRENSPMPLPVGTRWVTHQEIERVDGPEQPVHAMGRAKGQVAAGRPMEASA
ncbi:protein containing DUF58 [Rhodopirellula sallentina SM41]|uniref:Protein containing DUF58 n=2 Tax=Rhodopirellula TaxID=265488 RepID=M5U878_9BACT|nr:protein containing DUF58 [Rhodopirellula sallentina SM41]